MPVAPVLPPNQGRPLLPRSLAFAPIFVPSWQFPLFWAAFWPQMGAVKMPSLAEGALYPVVPLMPAAPLLPLPAVTLVRASVTPALLMARRP
jgi:hypothetical protein